MKKVLLRLALYLTSVILHYNTKQNGLGIMKAAKPIIAVLTLAATTHLAGCGVGEASVADSEAIQAATPVPVQVVRPFREDIFATYSATATISSDADAPVVARVNGDVVQLLVEEGEYVSAGQALARLDGERLRLEMLAAKANLEQARSELARNTDLHDRGLISAAAFDNLQFTLEALQATYELRKLEHGYATIRAPISGYVASREIKPGQHLSVDEVAFRIRLYSGDTGALLGEVYWSLPAYGMTQFNAIFNTIFVVALLLPVILTLKEMRRDNSVSLVKGGRQI